MLNNGSEGIVSSSSKLQCNQCATFMLKKGDVDVTTSAMSNLVATKSLLRKYGIDCFHPSLRSSVQPKQLLEELQSISSQVLDTFYPAIEKKHLNLEIRDPSSQPNTRQVRKRTEELSPRILSTLQGLEVAMSNRAYFDRNQKIYLNKSDEEIEKERDLLERKRLRARAKEFKNFDSYLEKKQKIFENAASKSLSKDGVKKATPIMTAILCSMIDRTVARAMISCFFIRISPQN